MPSLHALFVSIDQYPDPRHVLRGCINDGMHMHQYLESYCAKMGFTFRPLVLTDPAATRQAVIAGFDHFKAAEATDCCLFYYSGHGSRSTAPEVFWGLESDHSLESIVCYDSRLPGGHDLMDKELSYLIWQASEGRDLPFVTIMDCCHSGRMRDINEQILGSRNLRDVGPALPVTEFWGIEHYKKTADGQLIPPVGRRIHLGAARDTELANEVKVGGHSRGIFTYCLLEALDHTGPLVSYTDLLNRVNLRVRQNVKDQSAQLDATFAEDRNRGFLFSRIASERPSYMVSWDKEQAAWVLNAGAMLGIPVGDADSRTVLELADDKHQIQVENVLSDCAVVSGMDGYDTKRIYVAAIYRRAIPKMRLSFVSGSELNGMEVLTALIQKRASDVFQLQEHTHDTDYLIHALDGAYFLSRVHDTAPLFSRVSGYNETNALDFFHKLEKVANWQQLLELQHPDTGIEESEVDIQLFRLMEAKNELEMDNDVPVAPVDWRQTPVVFPYFCKNGTYFKPAFQLKLRNNGQRTLWVGLLYLGSDFSIKNALITKQALGPGEEVWAIDENGGGYSYRTIPLQIDDNRLSTIDEYIKVLISTEELHIGMYDQDGLDADTEPHRALGLRQRPKQKDWSTKTIWLQIEKTKTD